MEIFKMLYKIIAEHNKQQEPQDRALRNPAINWLSVWFYIVYNSNLGSSKQTVNNSLPSSPKICIFSIKTEWLMVSNSLERWTSYRLVTNFVSRLNRSETSIPRWRCIMPWYRTGNTWSLRLSWKRKLLVIRNCRVTFTAFDKGNILFPIKQDKPYKLKTSGQLFSCNESIYQIFYIVLIYGFLA